MLHVTKSLGVSKVKRDPDGFVFHAINSFHEKANRKVGKLAQSDACADNNSVHNFRRSTGARRKVVVEQITTYMRQLILLNVFKNITDCVNSLNLMQCKTGKICKNYCIAENVKNLVTCEYSFFLPPSVFPAMLQGPLVWLLFA